MLHSECVTCLENGLGLYWELVTVDADVAARYRCVHTQSLLEFQENCFALPDYFKFSTKLQLQPTQQQKKTHDAFPSYWDDTIHEAQVSSKDPFSLEFFDTHKSPLLLSSFFHCSAGIFAVRYFYDYFHTFPLCAVSMKRKHTDTIPYWKIWCICWFAMHFVPLQIHFIRYIRRIAVFHAFKHFCRCEFRSFHFCNHTMDNNWLHCHFNNVNSYCERFFWGGLNYMFLDARAFVESQKWNFQLRQIKWTWKECSANGKSEERMELQKNNVLGSNCVQFARISTFHPKYREARLNRL